MKCAVLCCRNNRRYTRHKSFFRFPKDKDYCRIWLQCIGRLEYKPSPGSNVCEDHFEGNIWKTTSQTRLKMDAVPSHDSIKCEQCNPKKKIPMKPDEEFSTITALRPDVNDIVFMPIALGDCLESSDEEGGTVEEIRQHKKLQKLREEMKRLHQGITKSSDKNTKLTTLLSEIKGKNLITDEVVEEMEKSGLNWNNILKEDKDEAKDIENGKVKKTNPDFQMEFIEKKKLIQLVRRCPVLYDTSSKNYGNITTEISVWKSIGNNLNLSRQQCCNIWTDLKLGYSDYFKREPAKKPTKLQKEMHFLWPLHMERFCNEIYLATDQDNKKFILDSNDTVAEGFNYKLLDRIAPEFDDSYNTFQNIGPYRIEIWENISVNLGRSIKDCFQTFLRLRKHYLEVLSKKFQNQHEKPKITTKFEIRMKFLWGTIKKLFPKAPHDFYDDIDDSFHISERNSNPELIISDRNEEVPINKDRSKSNFGKKSITRDEKNLSYILNKYCDEFKKNLIKNVKEYPVLYDGVENDQVSWHKSLDKSVWNIIAKEICCNGKECFHLWNCLKESFVQQLKTAINNSSQELSWKFYEDMEFLLPYIKDNFYTSVEKKEKYKRQIMDVCRTKEDDVLKLITIVEKYPVLSMPPSRKKYIDRYTHKYKRHLWKSIAIEMNWNDNECRDVWRYIFKKYYIFLKTNYEEDIGSYKKALSFLKQYMLEKNKNNSPLISSEDEDANIEFDQNDDAGKSIKEDQNILLKFQHQKLLNCVSKHKSLYDYTKLSSTDENLIWKSISKELKVPENKCSATWRNLHFRYLLLNTKLRAQTTEEDRFYLDNMLFLKPFITKHEEEPEEENVEKNSDCEDIFDNVEFPTEEARNEIAKIILKEVQKYPLVFLDSENTEYAIKTWKIISNTVQIPALACISIFLEEVENYKNCILDRFSNPHAKQYNLEDDMNFMKSYVESDAKETIINNCKKLIKIIRKYPALYSSNTTENSTVWEKVAKDMSWTTKDCITKWEEIKDQFTKHIANKTFDKNWIFRDDLLFLKLSYIIDELNIDNLSRISEDVDLNLFVYEILKYPCLYDSELQTSDTEIIWCIIGKHLKLSTSECKRFWRGLPTIYLENIKRQFKEDSAHRIKNDITPNESSIIIPSSCSEGNEKRINDAEVSEKMLLDNESSNDEVKNVIMHKLEIFCEERVITDCSSSPVETTLDVIGNALEKSNSNVGDGCFTITKLYSDSDSQNNNIDDDVDVAGKADDSDNDGGNRNDLHPPKKRRVE